MASSAIEHLLLIPIAHAKSDEFISAQAVDKFDILDSRFRRLFRIGRNRVDGVLSSDVEIRIAREVKICQLKLRSIVVLHKILVHIQQGRTNRSTDRPTDERTLSRFITTKREMRHSSFYGSPFYGHDSFIELQMHSLLLLPCMFCDY